MYGIPVVFGPKHKSSQEAVKLAELGGGFVVEDTATLHQTLRTLFENEEMRKRTGAIAANFVQQNVGATERFLKHLERYL